MKLKQHSDYAKPALFEYANIKSKPLFLQENPKAVPTTEHTLEQLKQLNMLRKE